MIILTTNNEAVFWVFLGNIRYCIANKLIEEEEWSFANLKNIRFLTNDDCDRLKGNYGKFFE